jgi:hypothetical protein
VKFVLIRLEGDELVVLFVVVADPLSRGKALSQPVERTRWRNAPDVLAGGLITALLDAVNF